MGMMSQHQIRAAVNGCMSKLDLYFIGRGLPLHTPMEADNDNLRTCLLQTLHISSHLLFTAQIFCQFIGTYKPYLHTLDLHQGSPFITKTGDSGAIQCVYGICIALLSIIPAVIICQIRRFHRSLGKNLRIRERRFKSKLFLSPALRLCQGSLHIHDSQIILTEDRLYFSEKIGWVSYRIIDSCKSAFIVKIFIRPQRTVACRADCDRHCTVLLPCLCLFRSFCVFS